MRNYFFKLFVVAGIFLSPYLVNAQRFIPDELKLQLQGKRKLTDIMQVVDAFYDNGQKVYRGPDGEGENAYLHWKRWEWWMSSHLDGNGNFVKNFNLLNYQAWNEADRRWGNEINNFVQQNRNNITISASEREQNPARLNGGTLQRSFGDWVLVGPTADGAGPGDIKGLGRLDRIAFHPSDANTIYVGAPTGNLWKTTNGGTSWISVTDGLTNPGVSGIAISPTNGNTVYLLTGDGDSYQPGYLVYDYGSSRASIGVFKSTNGGSSWTRTGELFTGGDYEGHRLAISPTNGNYLFATTSQGIYRTVDGGNNWAQVKTGEHWDIEFKPGNDSVVYATSGTAIFYSTQGGRSGTWQTATTDFSVAASGRIELGVSANNANYVYALCGNAATGSYTGLFRSINSGVDYFRRSNTPNILGSEENGSDGNDQSDYDLGITIKPSDANYLATCGLNVWVSNGSNGGSTMVWSTKYREGYAGAANKYIHPDVHDVRYNPLNNYLYAATDGGIYRSTDDGTSWTNITNAIATSQFYGMAMRDADADGDADGIGFLAGAQDNGMKYRNNSGTFSHIYCCDGYGTAISPDDPNILYFNINNAFRKSTNGGVSTTSIMTSTFFSPIVIDHIDDDTVYLGGTSTRRSYNGFTTTNLTIATSTRRVLTNCPSNQARLYGSAGTNVIRSDDRIATWTTKSGTAGWPAGTFTINDIDVYPTNSLEVYVCFGGYSAGNKVMRSTVGGDSWTNWSGSLPNVPCYGLAVATEGVYVGTEFGVFFRGYSMTDWVPFYNGMPRTPVTEIVVNDNGLVYASTFGRGVWLANRHSVCDAALSISGAHTGAYYYEASDAVNATITTAGTTGDEVFVQGGNAVTLNPGFEIKAGSYFKAYIAPCTNGGIPTTAKTATGEQIIVPRINEVKPGTKEPVSSASYFSVAGGRIEFNLNTAGKIEMLGKQNDGSWKTFYPEQAISPGFYYIPAPNAFTGEIKVRVNGRDIERLHEQ